MATLAVVAVALYGCIIVPARPARRAQHPVVVAPAIVVPPPVYYVP
jgi:hypothetical protein